MKLPQDTEVGITSWRSLILIFQLFGMFPFSVSKVHSAPKFTPILFLWSVFLLLFFTCMTYRAIVDVLLPLMTLNVGSMVFVYSLIFLVASQNLMLCTMLMASHRFSETLVNIMSRLELGESAEGSRSCKARTITLVIYIICREMFSCWYVIYVAKIHTVVEVICMGLYSFILFNSDIFIIELSFKVFDLLSSSCSVLRETWRRCRRRVCSSRQPGKLHPIHHKTSCQIQPCQHSWWNCRI